MAFELKQLKNLFKYKNKTMDCKVKEINSTLPIRLKYNQDLIDRIYAKYPYIEKHEISNIVLTTFYTIREMLIIGNIINIYNLFFNMKLYFFHASKSGDIISRLKGEITTPPKLRKK